MISALGSEEQTPKASMPHHHTASSHAKQSPSLAVTDNDGEPVGDRWDDDEDWGSLEVGFVPYLKFNRFTKTQNFQIQKVPPVIGTREESLRTR